MAKRCGLAWTDLTVTLGCVMLALMTFGAVGETGRGRAKEAVCQMNLHRWGNVFGEIVEENDGQFLSGVNDHGYWWPIQLSQELQDWKRNRTWFCPVATIPVQDERGTTTNGFTAWGIYRANSMSYHGITYAMNPNGIAGSYGLNGYLIPIPENSSYDSHVPGTYTWRDFQSIPDTGSVPMFSGALRFDLWPHYMDVPAGSEQQAWAGSHMAKACTDRHDGAVNCLFVDGSVRKVGLKELWTLQWHRSFDTAGPWTKAGGVLPTDWPEWMRAFKDY